MQEVAVEEKLPRMEIASYLCKGCGLCIAACPPKVIVFADSFNELGYKYATYKGEGCTGCGICFYSCPEPGAVTVYKKAKGE